MAITITERCSGKRCPHAQDCERVERNAELAQFLFWEPPLCEVGEFNFKFFRPIASEETK